MAVNKDVVGAAIVLLRMGVGKETEKLRDEAQEVGLEHDLARSRQLPPSGHDECWRAIFHAQQNTIVALLKHNLWIEGRKILCGHAEYLREKREKVPSWIEDLIIWAARDGAEARLEGCKPAREEKKAARDLYIALAVRTVMGVTGLKLARNHDPSLKGSDKKRKRALARSSRRRLSGSESVRAIVPSKESAQRSGLKRPIIRRSRRKKSTNV
jgi:hypothetical protein